MRGLMVAVLLCGCRPSGMEPTAAEEIGAVRDLETLMRVQAEAADPQFDMVEALDDPGAMTEAQLLAVRAMGERLQLTARRLPVFTMGREFDELAGVLEAKALAVSNLARDGDRAAAASMTLSIRETCRACHEKFR